MAGTTLLAVAAASLHYLITPKVFRATTSIQIERRIAIPIASPQEAWYDSYWNLEYYPTQYRLLSSRGLAERVVRNLRLAEDPAFNPRRAASATGDAAAAVTPEQDAQVVAGLAGGILGGLEVNPIRTTQLVEISYRSHSPELAAKIVNGLLVSPALDSPIKW